MLAAKHKLPFEVKKKKKSKKKSKKKKLSDFELQEKLIKSEEFDNLEEFLDCVKTDEEWDYVRKSNKEFSDKEWKRLCKSKF